jgi:hypothetical protein
MPKIITVPPLGMMKIKVIKQNLPAAAKSPLKIRIKDPSSINSSVPETLRTVSKPRNILPKTLTATVPQNFTDLTKQGTAPPLKSSTFLRKKIVLPTKLAKLLVIKNNDFGKFGTKSTQNATSTPDQQNLIEAQRDGPIDDIEIGHSQAELTSTDFGDSDEDIKPEFSQLPTLKEDADAHSLISKRKRKQKVPESVDSNDSNSLSSNQRAKSRRFQADAAKKFSMQQKRAAQDPEDMQKPISPQPKKLKVSQTTIKALRVRLVLKDIFF